MRAIIRFSVDRENNSSLRNKLAIVLRRANFTRNKNTATYEQMRINASELSDTLNKFWAKVDGHAGPGRIDHFWMYCDRKPLSRVRLRR